jgi:8-oxo-dGTP pyrophosphatase MutT (NUDIX family)
VSQEGDKTTIHPAATVLLLREANPGVELLYLRRNAELSFHGGAWVYPGGRIDHEDFADDHGDLDAAARRAAVREAKEEAGIDIDPTTMVQLAEWTTPAIRPKRFRTWFFAARAMTREVEIDGGEIHGFRWMQPRAALDLQSTGEIDLPGPTFVTSHWLAEYPDVDSALADFRARPVPRYLPRTQKIDGVEGGMVSLMPEDAAFAGGELDSEGPRHRIWMVPGAWRYEREPGR